MLPRVPRLERLLDLRGRDDLDGRGVFGVRLTSAEAHDVRLESLFPQVAPFRPAPFDLHEQAMEIPRRQVVCNGVQPAPIRSLVVSHPKCRKLLATERLSGHAITRTAS